VSKVLDSHHCIYNSHTDIHNTQRPSFTHLWIYPLTNLHHFLIYTLSFYV